MPSTSVRVVDVYPYRETGGGVEFLLLHRAAEQIYAGSWRMVGGKIGSGETAWQTARRELHEETGLSADPLWALPSVNAFYEWDTDRISLTPAFAACVDGTPALNAEHDDFAWLSPNVAAQRLAMPEQERLLRLAADLLAAPSPLPPSLIVDPDR